MKRKILLVTYPVDLGSATLAANLKAMLEPRVDLRHHVFSPKETPEKGAKLSATAKIALRIGSMPGLRRACLQAKAEGRSVIFQQTGAALFSWPFRHGLDCWIVLDWTRKLFEPITGQCHSSAAATALHRAMFASLTGALPFTEPVSRSLKQSYSMSAERVRKVPMPFDVAGMRTATPNPVGPLRILFVGGDFERKGGASLLRWFEASQRPSVRLTMVTQSDVCVPSHVALIRNDPAQTARELLADHDLFVLPTARDAFPLAIGEAAAAGLAIVTTRNALGSGEVVQEGINGHIVGDEVGLHRVLDRLASDRDIVESYKRESRKLMCRQFSFESAFRAFEEAIDRDRLPVPTGREAEKLLERG